MADVEQLLFDLHVYSGSGYGYFLTCDAVRLRLARGEDWEPSLKALQREVTKQRACSYEGFVKLIRRISEIAWERNPTLLKTLAHMDVECAPKPQEFIDILYTYILRDK